MTQALGERVTGVRSVVRDIQHLVFEEFALDADFPALRNGRGVIARIVSIALAVQGIGTEGGAERLDQMSSAGQRRERVIERRSVGQVAVGSYAAAEGQAQCRSKPAVVVVWL